MSKYYNIYISPTHSVSSVILFDQVGFNLKNSFKWILDTINQIRKNAKYTKTVIVLKYDDDDIEDIMCKELWKSRFVSS